MAKNLSDKEYQGINTASLPSDDTVFPVSWYPVMWARDLKKKPQKRRLVGLDLVIFRDGRGHPRALHAYCPHRGADLSLGKCVKDGLQCAYHGWEFGGDGMCKQIPAHPTRPIPDFARVESYPAEEKAGLIWVYPKSQKAGAGDVQPLRVFDELSDTRYRLAPYEQKWNAHLTRVVESVLDVAHLAFVHKKTIGKRIAPAVQNMKFEVENRDTIVIENGGGSLEYLFPGQWMLRPSGNRDASFINYVAFSPIDRQETIIFGYAGRTFARFVPGLNRVFSKFSLKVLEEDRVVVESQHPRPIPEALRMEAHVPADAPQVRFRQRWFAFLSGAEDKVFIDREGAGE